jgi:exopolyphosphatase/guanosine-5'-triphosphate,3'-diphosphate pyrophosphatase
MTLRFGAISGGLETRRVGVVDIGSNSIRLVIYDGLTRAPVPIMNQKITVGLGANVEATGRLDDVALEHGIQAVVVLVRMAEAMGVRDVELLATAAVRDAENGVEFRLRVEKECQRPVKVLTGEEEARMSAVGVISAMPDANGIIGDLGGGSLELIAVEAGQIRESTSVPLGPLRLVARAGGEIAAAQRFIDAELDAVDWLEERLRGATLYAVGGAWRAVARVHMAHTDYPLRIVHGYGMDKREAREFGEMLISLSPSTLNQINAVSRKRADTLPWAALVMDKVLKVGKPEQVLYSAQGLREGFHFMQLDLGTRDRDPLLSVCMDTVSHERRFEDNTGVMESWMAPIFPDDTPVIARLRHAACILSDLGWHEHPEYRAEQSMYRVLRMQWSVVDHMERAFLALVIFVRYGGGISDPLVEICQRLLSDEQVTNATAIGKALRLAWALTGSQGYLLSRSSMAFIDDRLTLTILDPASVPSMDRVERYAASLGRVLGRELDIVMRDEDGLEQRGAAQ